jgi:hypothetical protein
MIKGAKDLDVVLPAGLWIRSRVAMRGFFVLHMKVR